MFNRFPISLKQSFLVLFLVISVGRVLAQGSLTPPGIPAPTMKTLDQIEARNPISSIPFTISQSGSYYLTSNLTGVAAQNGIVIAADNVSLDMRGFTLKGVSNSLDGIALTSGRQNIAVRNGKLTSWGQWGVDAANSNNTAFVDLQILGNGLGLRAQANATVERCQAYGNSDFGFIVVLGSRIVSCGSQKNTKGGFQIGDGTVISNSTAIGNTTLGIDAGLGSVITGCTIKDNGGIGIQTNASCKIDNCTVRTNGGNGITAAKGAIIMGCTSIGNGGNGIVVGTTSLVKDCNVGASGYYDGIQASRSCVIQSNICDNEGANYLPGGGTGIWLFQHSSYVGKPGMARVEGNTVTNYTRGYRVDTPGNLIIRNSATGNTDNYGTIAAGNTVGPIVGSSNIGSSNNPHANYQY